MQFKDLSPQAKGLLITTLGVLALTPDTLLVRLVELDSITLLFWRGVATLTGLSLLTALQFGTGTVQQFRKIGKTGLGVAILMSCSSFCFVLALYHTSVANTLVIISSSPMFAALYSRLLLKEKVASRTMVAMTVVIIAISAIVSDSKGANSISGNLIAMGAAISMAGAFTLMRKGKDRNMVPATALSGLVVLLIAGGMSDSLSLTSAQVTLVFFMALSSITGFFFITIGTRFITAPEVSLLMPLETVLGTLLVWLILYEAPSLTAIIGGIAVIGALTLHSFISLRSSDVHRLK